MATITQPRPGRGVLALTRKRGHASLWEEAAPYVFVAPLIAMIAIFIYWPLLYSGYLSLFDWNFVSPEKTFVGAGNFARLLREPRFMLALRQTVVYIAVLVPVQVMMPLGVALLLWPIRRSAAQGVYRVLLFAPTVVSFPVAALLWLWIFNPLQGVLNQAILSFGGGRVNWLGNPSIALWCVILVAVWKTFGFNLLLYLAALEAVPGEYIEAAEIDGATGWQLTRYVRWPLIMPTFFFVLVTTVIAVNDEVFGAISVLTDGGPFDRTTNIIYYLYEQGFRFFQIGVASAVAILLFLLTIALTWLQFRFIEGRVHYG